MPPASDSGLSLGQIGGLVGFSVMLVGGQILFKTVALAAPLMTNVRAVISLLLMPTFWAAMILYCSATLIWIYLLQTVPLSRAYPFAALGFVIVPLAGLLLFNERVSLTYGVGVVLIIAGILTIARS